MAVTKAERAAYNNQIKEYNQEIDKCKANLKEVTGKMRSMTKIKPYYNLEAVLVHIRIISLFIKMNDISVEMLDQKNESLLNNARKEIYKVLQLLEEVVGSDIDRSLRENEEYIKKIDKVNPAQILSLIRNLQDVVDKMITRMGEGKWKWSFVDIQGRIAVIAKNFVNFSDIQKYRDPRTEFYRDRIALLKICKDGLNESAKQFRTRYEVSTNVPADMIKAIDFLSVLRRIIVLMGNSGEAVKLKNTIDALRERMESDEKKKDTKKKKSKVQEKEKEKEEE